ncbi:MAG: chemotaxis response regulator protein-glutamate methylesterase [Coriobacteriia bacterium]|nr:chemotaxis response regulator protein-glutamate methylesterase [Coriobacteriia bacterium]
MRSTVKVLVVDDSALTRQLLTRALGVDPSIEVVGAAKTGIDAIEKCLALRPDVMTLDIEMPELTGIEALPHIIRTTPTRVVMLSAVDDPDTTYQALMLGATDFIVKPASGFASSLADLSDLLIKKIKTAYRVRPESRLVARVRDDASATRLSLERSRVSALERVVAIAASTGGPPALETVFSGLGADLPVSYVVVQHLPAGFTDSLARRLGRVTDIEVVTAADGDRIEPGVAYVAPHGVHMRIAGRSAPKVVLDDAPSMHGVRPAADPTLQSVAARFADRAVGVVLTGMGTDGVAGLRAITDAGGDTIVQDEQTSVVWGMPGAAVRAGVASRVVPLDRVASEIRRSVRG